MSLAIHGYVSGDTYIVVHDSMVTAYRATTAERAGSVVTYGLQDMGEDGHIAWSGIPKIDEQPFYAHKQALGAVVRMEEQPDA